MIQRLSSYSFAGYEQNHNWFQSKITWHNNHHYFLLFNYSKKCYWFFYYLLSWLSRWIWQFVFRISYLFFCIILYLKCYIDFDTYFFYSYNFDIFTYLCCVYIIFCIIYFNYFSHIMFNFTKSRSRFMINMYFFFKSYVEKK